MKKILRTLLYIISFSVVGFLYYYFIGCEDGTCAITSSPVNSVFFSAVLGYCFSIIFEKKDKLN